MVAVQPGVVVLVRFPFSDLSSTKLRPAVILPHAGGHGLDPLQEQDLQAWTANWQDLVDFEIVPVRTSAEAAAAIAPQL